MEVLLRAGPPVAAQARGGGRHHARVRPIHRQGGQTRGAMGRGAREGGQAAAPAVVQDT